VSKEFCKETREAEDEDVGVLEQPVVWLVVA
jgi:hypothetical protein